MCINSGGDKCKNEEMKYRKNIEVTINEVFGDKVVVKYELIH